MSSTDCSITRAASSLTSTTTDTGGFSDHVFAMCRLLGFRFAPRIRALKEKRLYLLPGMTVPPEFASLVAGAINVRAISDQWFELLRLALSIKTGTVTASVILRKLAAYPRQNSLALALRELGKLERTFFTLQWLQDPSVVVVATSASTRVSSKMHSAAPYSSTGSAKSATAPMRTSATAPAV